MVRKIERICTEDEINMIILRKKLENAVTYYDTNTANAHNTDEGKPVVEKAIRASIPLLAALGLQAVDKYEEYDSVNDKRYELRDESDEEQLKRIYVSVCGQGE